MRFTDSGDNVPCQSIMKHNYDYMSTATNKYKYYDYSYAGMLCSLSKNSLNLFSSFDSSENKFFTFERQQRNRELYKKLG